ncbi:MAG TPA: DUF362 domain-containing protein [Desulfobulbus sp.]|nr:DUF362 domain-containing protein [Desulfobulbus sp.]
MEQGTIYTTAGAPLVPGLGRLLDRAGLARRVSGAGTVLIKPNLVDALAPPVTTPVDIVEALIDWLREACDVHIVIGEGTAANRHDTWYVFARLGYVDLARRKGVELVDLNSEQTVCRRRTDCRRWPELHLPLLAYDAFLLSVPVLKAHTMDAVTLTLKNMMGLAPPAHYQEGDSWKKSAFHRDLGQAVADLNRYRCPDFTLLDARVGMAEAHLFGPVCDPPVGMLVAGYDPVAVDARGASLLGKDWRQVEHIRRLHGELGLAEPLRIIEVEDEGGRNEKTGPDRHRLPAGLLMGVQGRAGTS